MAPFQGSVWFSNATQGCALGFRILAFQAIGWWTQPDEATQNRTRTQLEFSRGQGWGLRVEEGGGGMVGLSIRRFVVARGYLLAGLVTELECLMGVARPPKYRIAEITTSDTSQTMRTNTAATRAVSFGTV